MFHSYEEEAKQENDAIDAKRWRAFLKSGRLRRLGDANLSRDCGEDPLYAHMGLEIWTKYEGFKYDARLIAGNEEAQALLIKYADKMREILGD